MARWDAEFDGRGQGYACADTFCSLVSESYAVGVVGGVEGGGKGGEGT